MRMIPPQPYNNNSYAELKVFDVFRNIDMPEAVCFNSLHLVSHVEKRISEIDFILLCRRGVFVFEVKGGRVYQHEGKWFSKAQQKKIRIENPFNQSRNGAFSLLNSLKQKGLIPSNVPLGYGVLLPNTVYLSESIEYTAEMLGSKGDLKAFSSWLLKFISYWESKIDLPHSLSQRDIEKIANYLRPGTIGSKDHDNGKVSIFDHLNIKQQQVVTAFQAKKRIICEGAAGTGKTYLVSLLVKECVEKRDKVLILCESKWLKGYLKSQLEHENVVVSTIDSLIVDSRRSFISKYDVVIVDEAQDLYQPEKVAILELYLKEGIDKGRWILFQDLINQGSFFNIPNECEVNRFKVLSHVELSLDLAYRYSRVTLKYLSKLLGSRFINTKKIKGPEVEFVFSNSKEEEIKNIQSFINLSIKKGSKLSDITLLSPKSYNDSVVSNLPSVIKLNLDLVDDFNVRTFPSSKMSFSKLEYFKGLENKVVILTDYSESCLDNTAKAYVALTRATQQQYVVLSSGKEVIERNDSLFNQIELYDDIDSKVIDWNEVIELTILNEECEYFISKKVKPPICGYELVHHDMVVADVELAWPHQHVCIFSDDISNCEIKKFISQGWSCFQAPLSNDELNEISRIVML